MSGASDISQPSPDLTPSGHALSDSSGPAKKRRKSRKGLQKAFDCEEPGCGKQFTRLEHLSRHQLNHRPKEIFKCSWHDCERTFVREDLLARHEKRHEKRGTNVLDPPLGLDGLPDPPPKKVRGRRLGSMPKNPIPKEAPHEEPRVVEAPLDHLQDISMSSALLDTPIFSTVTPVSDIMSSSVGPDFLTDHMGSATDIISWLFSDAMLANVQEPLLSPNEYTAESPMALKNLIAPPAFHDKAGINEHKQQQMLNLIPGIKDSLAINGIPEDAPFQERYMAAYWATFHAQFPILHKPTFRVNDCPSGLLWIMIAIGAAVLKEVTLGKCIATPLRWAIFESADFNPPAKLWVIQALLLLEVYEKALSDRQLHVRAHVHHGTTLQLVRRGTLLTGVTNEFPRPEQRSGDGDEYLSVDSSDPWKRWIQSEATKRAALMAFVIDAYHNSLFGHASLISIHEIRLSLPCSQQLWDAFPVGEDGTSDYRKLPTSNTLPLIEALKLTLNKQRVETSPFGRRVLLSGLMSISIQMQQRDFQLDSLGWLNNGNPLSHSLWRDQLRSTYNFLINDYKEMLHLSELYSHRPPGTYDVDPYQAMAPPLELSPLKQLVISGCADPFFHMAHINMQVSILDLHIFAGACYMFSRSFRPGEIERTARSMKSWATSLNGTNALRHAILFLEEMFCPAHDTHVCPNPFAMGEVVHGGYIAEKDPLVHRPHAVYMCTLVVWCYCFALYGPESDALRNVGPDSSAELPGTPGGPSLVDAAATALANMKHIPAKRPALSYIRWLSKSLSTPKPPPMAPVGCNEMAGLLRLVIGSFEGCSWTLIPEDARLLTHCLERTLGRPVSKCLYHF